MALAPGTRIGPYEVSSQIGAGGMGEVYRAVDINLKRAVAIKVLPEVLASDPDRLARLQREAEVLASLNHPNIAQIYGLEKSDPSIGAGQACAIVMEFVDGATLADRIAQGPIPIDEALTKLEMIDRRQARIVELRYFGDLTLEETAAALKISRTTVADDWAMARAWLHRELTR